MKADGTGLQTLLQTWCESWPKPSNLPVFQFPRHQKWDNNNQPFKLINNEMRHYILL